MLAELFAIQKTVNILHIHTKKGNIVMSEQNVTKIANNLYDNISFGAGISYIHPPLSNTHFNDTRLEL